jgi:prolyl oligopeptidase
MGDPTTEAGFNGVLLQDAYQMLASAKDMPDTVLTIGLNDNRVVPWMSAKYAARALKQFGDKRLVLIRADSEQGHGIGSGRELVIQEMADVYSFVFNRAGVGRF